MTAAPAWVQMVALAGLVSLTAAYLVVMGSFFGRRVSARRYLVVVAVLGVALAGWLGPSWAGLLIYVSAASAVALPQRWVWPAVLGCAGVCVVVVAADGQLGQLFILPVMCLLTGFALSGIRVLVSVNAELSEAREELARNAVAEERLRFANVSIPV